MNDLVLLFIAGYILGMGAGIAIGAYIVVKRMKEE
jgi:hypothetical protein